MYVNKNVEKYTVPTSISADTSLIYNTYTDSINKFNDINSFLQELTWEDVMVARKFFYSDANKFHQYKHYDIAAEATLPRTEKGVALIIYRFLAELNLASKVTIKINTANEPNAGTSEDNYVNLSFKFKNGSIRTVVLGHLNTNDFSQGSVGVYNALLYGQDYDLTEITEISLQKEGKDDWKVGTINIGFNGKWEIGQTLNQWLRKPTDAISVLVKNNN
ncbi:MAG: hypothetical protein U0T83_09760 [Bacteriovoracaceae bacterium]